MVKNWRGWDAPQSKGALMEGVLQTTSIGGMV